MNRTIYIVIRHGSECEALVESNILISTLDYSKALEIFLEQIPNLLTLYDLELDKELESYIISCKEGSPIDKTIDINPYKRVILGSDYVRFYNHDEHNVRLEIKTTHLE